MGAPISDEQYRKYAPKQLREQPPLRNDQQRDVPAAPRDPLSTDLHQNRRARREFTLWSGLVPEPPPRRPADGAPALIGRIAVVVTFAALGALLVFFAEPLWQRVSAL